MKLDKSDFRMIYWCLMAVVTFVEWTLGKGPEIGFFTAVLFAIVYAIGEAINEIRGRWVHRVAERYRV